MKNLYVVSLLVKNVDDVETKRVDIRMEATDSAAAIDGALDLATWYYDSATADWVAQAPQSEASIPNDWGC